ncbi:hypothetical protein Tco_0557907 [Tanacetum coccineum]
MAIIAISGRSRAQHSMPPSRSWPQLATVDRSGGSRVLRPGGGKFVVTGGGVAVTGLDLVVLVGLPLDCTVATAITPSKNCYWPPLVALASADREQSAFSRSVITACLLRSAACNSVISDCWPYQYRSDMPLRMYLIAASIYTCPTARITGLLLISKGMRLLSFPKPVTPGLKVELGHTVHHPAENI